MRPLSLCIISAVLMAHALSPAARGQFLVPDQQFRCPATDKACPGTHKPPAFELGLSEYNHNPYTINYVEYPDKGDFYGSDHSDVSAQELNDALSQIKAAGADGQYPLIVLYVHGWQNNASELSGDVGKFRYLMSRLADNYYKDGATAQPVLGIYMGWRGLTFTVEPFKHIVSYWPRRYRARKLGRSNMHDAIEQIERAVNEDQTIRKRTSFIMAGHSFGARVLENAIDDKDFNGNPGCMRQHFETLKHIALQARTFSSGEREAKLQKPNEVCADLIVYVNAATSSANTRERLRVFEEDCREYPFGICKVDPLYVAFSSTNDRLTRFVMPVANLVFPDLPGDKLHLLSAADSPWMHTHDTPKLGNNILDKTDRFA